jgi:hypothetical protein
MIWDSRVDSDSLVLDSGVDSDLIVSDSGFTEASTDAFADVGDSGREVNCEFTGEPRIEPADAEISTTQRFFLEGISQIPPECLQWRISPSSFRVYGSSDRISVDFDRDTGELRITNRINNTAFEIFAFIADEWVATTSVHFFDKDQPITGVFREVAVLGCPDYSEIPREMIDEIIINMGPSIRELVMEVTFVPFESYVDYRAVVNWIPDIIDAHQGGFEFFVDWAALEPDTLDKEGRYIVRPDGRLELRDLWLGPDAAQCGHMIERWAVY